MNNEQGDRQALDRLLATPEIAWLVDRVRDRLIATGDKPLSGLVVLQKPSPAQRSAVTRLVGPPKRAATTLRVQLADVEAILRRGPWPAGLADAVVTLTGPAIDQAAVRSEQATEWHAAAAVLTPAVSRFEGLSAWWAQWCAAGGLKRVASAEARRRGVFPGSSVGAELVRELGVVLDALPATDVPLSVFARQVVGDAHGLDEKRPLGRLAASVVAEAFRPEEAPPVEVSRREAWARAGVVLSNVSSTVLALGLRGAPAATSELGVATATMAEAMRHARGALVLTLDQVRSGGIAPTASRGVVHVCENPTVVEVVARRWGQTSTGDGSELTLVCTSGQPSTAVVELLDVLTADGATCRYHGDFDWAGLRIARGLLNRGSWTPWRFGAADYRAAADADESALRLVGEPVEASWDPHLTAEMERIGRAVEEEAVLDDLVTDLMRGTVL